MTAAVRLDDWRPFSYWYAIFGDIEDDGPLLDNLEAFDVPAWKLRMDKKCFVMEGSEPLGVMFCKVPKSCAEQFDVAMENYARRMRMLHETYENDLEDFMNIFESAAR